MKKLIFYPIVLFIFLGCNSNKNLVTKNDLLNKNFERSKLVVGIVVDQMRYDYLIRFSEKYGEGGFKRIIKNGFNCKNTHFNYIPTYTAVGHASIYAGTTPQNHGIISNWWYDKYIKKSIYCVTDSTYQTVGAKKGGAKSPYRMQTTTIADQLKLAQNMNGKTIGISIKDRSSILTVGHTADAAYWYQGKNEGKFITSTYYKNELPKWVSEFNNSGIIDNFLKQPWNTYYDIETYTESIEDDNLYEEAFKGEKSPTFPHDVPNLLKKNKHYDMLSATPYGNTVVKDFAKAAIKGENLGKGSFTDLLAISFSSTDYIGHQFGVDSKEIEDTYIRLDKDIEDLLNFLDRQVGTDNYTLFLTADHAAVPVPSYLQSLKIPSGYFKNNDFKKYLNQIILKHYGSDKLIEKVSNFQIYLDKQEISKLKLNHHKVAQKIADEIINFENVYKSVTALTLQTTEFNTGLLNLLQQGYNQKFSGDILFIPNPSVIKYPTKGSTHGSGYSYDTHVPLIFYGKGIVKGISNSYTPIIDIAPTLSRLLEIEQPNGTTGKVIEQVIQN